MDPTFFATADALRDWLEQNHDKAVELWVGYYKKGSGRPSITWPESVDQALCFGWIDGVRKSLGADSYMIRFTPRRPGSIWSEVNRRRATELLDAGLMRDAGRRAFEARDDERTKQYTYERGSVELDAALQKQFRAHRKAWQFFQAQPPGYRKALNGWVVSAKKEETRQKRLAVLIAESEAGRRIDFMRGVMGQKPGGPRPA